MKKCQILENETKPMCLKPMIAIYFRAMRILFEFNYIGLSAT